MSALPAENRRSDLAPSEVSGSETVVVGAPVVVRRHAGLAALIGVAASAVAIAYLWRASQTVAVVDWGLFATMALVAGFYLASLVDSRTPLLVADDLGVRIRLGDEWRGLPWEAIDEVVVQPRRGVLRDGRLAFVPHSIGRALEGLEGKGRRHARANQKAYGAALAVPIGMTTRLSPDSERGVGEEIAALSMGRARVTQLVPDGGDTTPDEVGRTDSRDRSTAERHDAPEARDAGSREADAGQRAGEHVRVVDDRRADPASTQPERTAEAGVPRPSRPDSDSTVPVPVDAPAPRPARLGMLGGIGTIVSRVAKGGAGDARGAEADPSPADRDEAGAGPTAHAGPGVAPAVEPRTAVPLRETRPASRAQVTRDLPASHGSAALFDAAQQEKRPQDSEARALRRPGSVDLVFEQPDGGRVRPISQLGDPVEPLVIDDFATEPAYDPVIGPELAAARTRLGLSVDELADRTRIRPHVIESIEVDDFGPCGGDFYARGHLRTLARVLGKDVAPLLETFDERYATAPINARRVFEAELATGMVGSMRSTMRGPNWGLLVGVVLSLVLVWGVVRLFSSEAPELVQGQSAVLNDQFTAPSQQPVPPKTEPVVKRVPITLVAAHSDSRVVVRDGKGVVVFSGELVLGERKRLRVAPPIRVRAADAGAVEVVVAGRNRGVIGVLGEPGFRTYR